MIKPPVVYIQPSTVYRNERVLPIDGDIVARIGDTIHPDTPIARVVLPSPSVNVSVATALGVRPKDLAQFLVKQVGDHVQQGDIIARRKATMLQGKRESTSPIDGTVEYISYDDGQVTIRRPSRQTVIWAEAVGKVTEIVPRQSIIVETGAAVIQGAFGVGEEVQGQLRLPSDNPNEKLSSGHLDRSLRGSVIAAGGVEDDSVITQAQALGVKGLILGGLKSTGHARWPILGKRFPMAIVVTEGFSVDGFYPAAFDVLRRNRDRQVWLRPSVQGKAEVIVLLPETSAQVAPSQNTMTRGSLVRVRRAPFFGFTGRVVDLPRLPVKLESGMSALVAEIETEGRRRIVVPLVNLELLS